MNITKLKIFITAIFLVFINSNYLLAQLSIKDVNKRVSPGVVTVLSYDKNGKLSSQGSGFIVKSNGLVVSNYHVVKNASRVQIEMENNDTYWIKGIVSFDKLRDFVILKIEGFDLPTVFLGNSNQVEIGDAVVAIGSPRGYDRTVSDGIVSQKRRREGGFQFLQTTAPISPGSSGGPLANMKGEVIGITTATRTDAQNLNFALPINYVRAALESSQAVKYSLAQIVEPIPKSKPPVPKYKPPIPKSKPILKSNPILKPTGNIEKVWVDYDVTDDSRKGMRIHAKFTAGNLKDTECKMLIYFYYKSGNALKDLNKKFYTTSGNVSSSKKFNPGYINSNYEDYSIFMPYAELHLTTKGKYDLKFHIELHEKSGKLIASTKDHFFQYEAY